MAKAEEDSASFTLGLEDETSGAAAAMSGSLKQLRETMDEDIASLKAMTAAMRNMKGSSEVSLTTFKQLKEQILAKKAAIATSQEKYIKLGGNLRDIGKAGKDGGGGLAKLGEAMKAGGGEIGSMSSGLSSLATKLGGLGLAGAAVAAAVALVALTAALTAYGIAQSNAARAELLSLDALTKMPNYYGLAAGSATELQGAIDGVASSSALARGKIAGYATDLYKMGLRGKNLNEALEATAVASSAAGEAYGATVKGMLAGAAATGQSVTKLADTVKARFGGIAKAQTLDLNVQLSKMKENVGQLFAGLKIEGFLKALHMVTDLFSQNTFSGRALKVLIEGLFNPLIAGIEKAGPLAKRFFQGMVITALVFGIQMLKLRNAIMGWFGKPGLFKGIDWMNVALKTGIFVASLFVVVIGTIVAAVALLGAALYAVGYAIYAIGKAMYLLLIDPFVRVDWGALWAKMTKPFKDALEWFRSINWEKVGTDIVEGIAGGLRKGYKLVADAVKGIGKAALRAFGVELESHSPSKKFFELGYTAPQGAADAMKAGTPMVSNAASDMIDKIKPPDLSGIASGVRVGNDNARGGAVPAMASITVEPSAAAPVVVDRGGAPAPSSSGPKVEIKELHYHSSGRENHLADAEDFKTKLESVLEGAAIRLGAA
jgi:hypothetical protein